MLHYIWEYSRKEWRVTDSLFYHDVHWVRIGSIIFITG